MEIARADGAPLVRREPEIRKYIIIVISMSENCEPLRFLKLKDF